MEDLKLIIEDYKRRLETIDMMLQSMKLSDNKIRLETKASCYRSFLAELNRIVLNSKDF